MNARAPARKDPPSAGCVGNATSDALIAAGRAAAFPVVEKDDDPPDRRDRDCSLFSRRQAGDESRVLCRSRAVRRCHDNAELVPHIVTP